MTNPFDGLADIIQSRSSDIIHEDLAQQFAQDARNNNKTTIDDVTINQNAEGITLDPDRIRQRAQQILDEEA